MKHQRTKQIMFKAKPEVQSSLYVNKCLFPSLPRQLFKPLFWANFQHWLTAVIHFGKDR